MLDLGLGSYLEKVEQRWGQFWSGLLMLVIYLTILVLCVPFIWDGMVKFYAWGYGTSLDIMRGVAVLRVPTTGIMEVLRRIAAVAVMLVVTLTVFFGAIAIFAWAMVNIAFVLARITGKPPAYFLPISLSADHKGWQPLPPRRKPNVPPSSEPPTPA
jgi:hypothetical protein